MIILAACLLALFPLPGFTAELEYSGYYMKRKQQAEGKKRVTRPKAAIRGKGSNTLVHTSAMKPACRLFFVSEAGIKENRLFVTAHGAKGAEEIPLFGVKPSQGRESLALDFLKEAAVGGFLKICRPELKEMPEDRSYGFFYVEPVEESLQEILLEKGLAERI